MSDVLETASPAEMCQYDHSLWGTFLPYLRCLYKPPTVESVPAETSDGGVKLMHHISCCNVLLYVLEAVFGRYVDQHLEILVLCIMCTQRRVLILIFCYLCLTKSKIIQ